MKSISNSNSIDSYREPIFKKLYVKIFTLSLIFLIVGAILTSITTFLESVDYDEAGYDDYVLLMIRLSTSAALFEQIGIVLFSMSAFIGAISDQTLSIEVRRGMIITSGIGIVALVIFSRMLIYFY